MGYNLSGHETFLFWIKGKFQGKCFPFSEHTQKTSHTATTDHFTYKKKEMFTNHMSHFKKISCFRKINLSSVVRVLLEAIWRKLTYHTSWRGRVGKSVSTSLYFLRRSAEPIQSFPPSVIIAICLLLWDTAISTIELILPLKSTLWNEYV